MFSLLVQKVDNMELLMQQQQAEINDLTAHIQEQRGQDDLIRNLEEEVQRLKNQVESVENKCEFRGVSFTKHGLC